MPEYRVGSKARQCTRCGDVWPEEYFTKRGKVCRYCKDAASQLRGTYKADQLMAEEAHKKELVKVKYCRACGKTLPIDAFKTPQNKECITCSSVDKRALHQSEVQRAALLREAWYLYDNCKPIPERHIRAMHTDLVAKRRRGEVLNAKEKEALHNIEWMYEQRAKKP